MKKLKIVSLIAAIGFFQACNSSNNDNFENAKEGNDSAVTTKSEKNAASQANTTTIDVVKKDADFAVQAANGGIKDLKLGNYAIQNAYNPRVKQFGLMMIKNHTKSVENLNTLAASRNITLPTTTGKEASKDIADLTKKRGHEFDVAYINEMVDDQKKEVKEFEEASKEITDPGLKSFADNMLPVLNAQLDSAQAIANMYKEIYQ